MPGTTSKIRSFLSDIGRADVSVPRGLARIAAVLVLGAVGQRVYELSQPPEIELVGIYWRLILGLATLILLPLIWRGSLVATSIALVAIALSCSSVTITRSGSEVFKLSARSEMQATNLVFAAAGWLALATVIGMLRYDASARVNSAHE